MRGFGVNLTIRDYGIRSVGQMRIGMSRSVASLGYLWLRPCRDRELFKEARFTRFPPWSGRRVPRCQSTVLRWWSRPIRRGWQSLHLESSICMMKRRLERTIIWDRCLIQCHTGASRWRSRTSGSMKGLMHLNPFPWLREVIWQIIRRLVAGF
jgi:hypothetical protein